MQELYKELYEEPSRSLISSFTGELQTELFKQLCKELCKKPFTELLFFKRAFSLRILVMSLGSLASSTRSLLSFTTSLRSPSRSFIAAEGVKKRRGILFQNRTSNSILPFSVITC